MRWLDLFMIFGACSIVYSLARLLQFYELYREDINVDMMSRYRVETMMVPFAMAASSPTKFNLLDVTKETMEHFLFGLATLKGYKLIIKYKEDHPKKKNHEPKLKR